MVSSTFFGQRWPKIITKYSQSPLSILAELEWELRYMTNDSILRKIMEWVPTYAGDLQYLEMEMGRRKKAREIRHD